jgi:hypothetical protein
MVDLDDVLWPSLECSSGSATVVADLLREAADSLGDADSLDEIADQLAYELNDGGVLQSAALPAVP